MYKEKTDRELIELVKIQNKLTFESQLSLKSEFDTRDIDIDILELENSIDEKTKKIKNLDYLKEIGFQLENNNDYLKISRTTKAMLIDLLAIFLGFLFCCVGFYGISGIIGDYSNEVDFNTALFVVRVMMIGIGYIGLKFLNGIKRLIDFSDFELIKIKEIITLKKRFDISISQIEINKSLIYLKEENDFIKLKIKETDVLSVSVDNLIHKMTLKELVKRFQN